MTDPESIRRKWMEGGGPSPAPSPDPGGGSGTVGTDGSAPEPSGSPASVGEPDPEFTREIEGYLAALDGQLRELVGAEPREGLEDMDLEPGRADLQFAAKGVARWLESGGVHQLTPGQQAAVGLGLLAARAWLEAGAPGVDALLGGGGSEAGDPADLDDLEPRASDDA